MSHLNLIGVELKVRTLQGQEITGQLYAEDTATKVIILCSERESKRDFHFVNTDAIARIEHINTLHILDQDLYEVDVDRILKRSSKDIRRQADQLARMNLQASSEAQFIFKEFSKHYECDWEGDAIMVLTLSASIKPPYTEVVCKENDSDYLSKLLEQGRKRFLSRD